MDFTKVKEMYKPPVGSDLELLPCPFCGGTEVVYFRYNHIDGDRFGVVCCDCMANIDPGYAQQKSTVQEKWNHRAASNSYGYWIPVDEKEDAFDCSKCDAMVSKRLNFCPQCGAKMIW